VSASVGVFLGATGRHARSWTTGPLAGALVLAGFAVAFGTRHADATEHQDG
jgi:Na+/proline symporter